MSDILWRYSNRFHALSKDNAISLIFEFKAYIAGILFKYSFR